MPSIGNPIPVGWSDYKFYLVSNTAGVALDSHGPDNGIDVHGWSFDENNDHQVWQLKCINDKANIWTLYNPLTNRKFSFLLVVDDGNLFIPAEVVESHINNGYIADVLAIRDGNRDNGAQMIGEPRKADNDIWRHNQEWFIYHVEGAAGPARVALQNVMSGTFLNNYGNGTGNG